MDAISIKIALAPPINIALVAFSEQHYYYFKCHSFSGINNYNFPDHFSTNDIVTKECGLNRKWFCGYFYKQPSHAERILIITIFTWNLKWKRLKYYEWLTIKLLNHNYACLASNIFAPRVVTLLRTQRSTYLRFRQLLVFG